MMTPRPSDRTETEPTSDVCKTTAPAAWYQRTTSRLGCPNRLCRPALMIATAGSIALTNWGVLELRLP